MSDSIAQAFAAAEAAGRFVPTYVIARQMPRWRRLVRGVAICFALACLLALASVVHNGCTLEEEFTQRAVGAFGFFSGIGVAWYIVRPRWWIQKSYHRSWLYRNRWNIEWWARPAYLIATFLFLAATAGFMMFGDYLATKLMACGGIPIKLY